MTIESNQGTGGSIITHDVFGTCCAELKEAISGQDFEPLITIGEDDVLYMAVGLIDLEDNEPGMVDHPLFYCPFCGTGIQTPQEVRGKVEAAEGGATS